MEEEVHGHEITVEAGSAKKRDSEAPVQLADKISEDVANHSSSATDINNVELGESSWNTSALADSILEDLQNKNSLDKFWCKCCIFRVPKLLREGMENAYTPMVVSIGPYHRMDERLHSMEPYKLECLDSFLKIPKREEFKGRPLLDLCLKTIKEKESLIREAYADPYGLTSDDFTRMVLLDSVFIIDRISPASSCGREDHVDAAFAEVRKKEIARDLLLLENQLPLFILIVVYNMAYECEGNTFIVEVLKFFGVHNTKTGIAWEKSRHFLEMLLRHHLLDNGVNIPMNHIVKESRREDKVSRIATCLDNLLRRKHLPKHDAIDINKKNGREYKAGEEKGAVNHDSNDIEKVARTVTCLDKLLGRRHPPETTSTGKTDTENGREFMSPTASCLNAAGVTFKVIKKVESSRGDDKVNDLLGIHFHKDKGILSMPKLNAEDPTQSLFRNMIALEQCMYLDKAPTYITDYLYFVDCLINTPEDVQLLSDAGIVENWVGSEAVCDMFNSISNNTRTVPSKYAYKDLSKQLNDHCNRAWNRHVATLKLKYFAHPWAYISVVYAVALLLLTIAQLVLAIVALP